MGGVKTFVSGRTRDAGCRVTVTVGVGVTGVVFTVTVGAVTSTVSAASGVGVVLRVAIVMPFVVLGVCTLAWPQHGTKRALAVGQPVF